MSKLNPIDNPIKIQCQGAETLPLDLILDFQGKLKKLSEANRSKLMQSICDKGFIAPLFLWDDSGDYRLLDGHGRLKTLLYMREQGWDIPMLPVVHVEADNEKDARSKLLSITSQYGEFDLNELNNWITDLDDDIAESLRLVDEEIDFNIDDLGEETNGDDDAPEVPEDPETVLGDLWELGDHRLLCGDSTEITTVEKLMDGQKADMVFTDPPYNIDFKGTLSCTSKNGKIIKAKDGYENPNTVYEDIKNDKMSGEDFEDFINSIILNIKEYCVGGWYICFSSSTLHELLIPLKNNDMLWKSIIIFNKNQSPMGGGHFRKKYEPIVYGYFNNLFYGKEYSEDDVWDIKRTLKNDLHPTMKPVELAEKAVGYSSNSGGRVLDLFGGSGTTLIASEKLNRKSNIMEFETKYCDVIVKRYINFCRENNKSFTVKLNGEEYTGALLDE